MISDYRTIDTRGLPADASVVIGSGAAGLAVALTLADGGEPVVLLESGGEPADAEAARSAGELNEAVQTGLPLDGVVNGRARMIGGTTALWHGQCMRLHEIDVERRPWVPHSGWPLALADLNDFYGEAERFLDVSGDGYGKARWDDHRHLPPIAWDAERLLHDFTEYTPRPHLGNVYRERLATHPSLELLHHATVSRVIVSNGRARGVEVVAAGQAPRTIAARRVVIATGGIENARLLMPSDPQGVGLGDGREHTGRYYQDHPIIRTAQVFAKDYRVLQDRYIALHRRGRRLFPKVRLAPGAQRDHGLLDATAVFVHDHDDLAREALRRVVDAARRGQRPAHPVQDTLRSLTAPVSVLRDTYRRYAKGLATGRRPSAVWLQLWIEQQPDPESRVTLAEARDALGLRQARLNWKVGDLELQTSRRLTRWVGDDLERLGIGRIEELPAMASDAAWRESVGDAAHPAGTTRMSASGAHGVVDAQLKVHGIHGLYVLGSSAFPISGYANPTLTIVALAFRLAEHLAAQSRRAAA